MYLWYQSRSSLESMEEWIDQTFGKEVFIYVVADVGSRFRTLEVSMVNLFVEREKKVDQDKHVREDTYLVLETYGDVSKVWGLWGIFKWVDGSYQMDSILNSYSLHHEYLKAVEEICEEKLILAEKLIIPESLVTQSELVHENKESEYSNCTYLGTSLHVGTKPSS